LVKVNGDVLYNVKAISAGNSYSLLLNNDGRVVSLGYDYGASNELAGVSNVVAVSRQLAIKLDGTIVTWGQKHSTAMATVPIG